MKTIFTSSFSLSVYLIVNILFFISFNENCSGQTDCYNSDFEFSNFTGWSGTTGFCCPIVSAFPGIVPGRQTIMTGPGTDPNTGGLLTVVAPGGLYSARLGNDNVGSQAEQLRYSFNVTTNNEMFVYRYAVVLQDPNHTIADQPRFEIRMFDQSGDTLSCGNYFVYAHAGIPGFQTNYQNGDTIHWKDWTSVGIDLTSYVGQTLTIEFSTGDCGLGRHFGYAYIDCYCNPLAITSDYCPGSNTTTMVAPPGFDSYVWNTGDTTQALTINNPLVGTTYTVTLISVSGCPVSLTQSVAPTIFNPSFTFQNYCDNSVQFTNTSTTTNSPPITSFFWNFGDGTTSNQASPTHVYPSLGLYNATLTVYNQNFCDSSITIPVNIISIIKPNFSFTPQCAGNPIQFTDSSTSIGSAIASWSWNFGDGMSNSTLQNPTHSYALQSTYNVSLIVTDLNGCVDTITKPLTVAPNPVARIAAKPGCPNTIITFKDSSVYNNGTINSWAWNFGDNSPISHLQNPSHLYSGNGPYNVSLRIASNTGCTDSTAMQLNLLPVPVADFYNSGGCINSPITFTDNTSNNPYQITNWVWNFGDGSPIESIQNPVHSFNNDQAYTVRLIVRSSAGCVDSVHKQLVIPPFPKADFYSDTVCLSKQTKFENLSTVSAGSISAAFWDFGDHSTSTLFSPGHEYLNTGVYDVRLTVKSDKGCIDSISGLSVVKKGYAFWIPNAFTPNADGINDIYIPLALGVTDFKMEIYDRWGIKIFSSNDIESGWDSKIDNNYAQSDVYVYRIIVTDECGDVHTNIGHFSLIR